MFCKITLKLTGFKGKTALGANHLKLRSFVTRVLRRASNKNTNVVQPLPLCRPGDPL